MLSLCEKILTGFQEQHGGDWNDGRKRHQGENIKWERALLLNRMTHFEVHDNFTWLLHLCHLGNVSCSVQLSVSLVQNVSAVHQTTESRKKSIFSLLWKQLHVGLLREGGRCQQVWSAAAGLLPDCSSPISPGGSFWTSTCSASFCGITSEPVMDQKTNFSKLFETLQGDRSNLQGTRKDQCFLMVQKRFMKL